MYVKRLKNDVLMTTEKVSYHYKKENISLKISIKVYTFLL